MPVKLFAVYSELSYNRGLATKSTTSRPRSAEATIKGFNFQFAATILLALQANDGSEITIEGIEDIDVKNLNQTDAVQCKYYEGTKLTNSVLRDILEPMLKDFSGRSTKINYHIYGHFKETVVFPLTDAARFKAEVLSYSKVTSNKQTVVANLADDLNLDIPTLATFLTHLQFQYTSNYDEHRTSVIQALRKQFNCSLIDAELFYYPNAFSYVAELGSKPRAERTVRKSEFLSKINSKQTIFNQWLLAEKTETAFCNTMRARFFSPSNASPFARFFIIECDGTETVSCLIGITHELRRKWSSHERTNRSTAATRYAPYILFRKISDKVLNEIKGRLYMERVRFVDGFPFGGAPFTPMHVNQDQTFENQISLRFLNNENELKLALEAMTTRTREIYQFYKTKPATLDFDVKHVQIPITTIDLINQII